MIFGKLVFSKFVQQILVNWCIKFCRKFCGNPWLFLRKDSYNNLWLKGYLNLKVPCTEAVRDWASYDTVWGLKQGAWIAFPRRYFHYRKKTNHFLEFLGQQEKENRVWPAMQEWKQWGPSQPSLEWAFVFCHVWINRNNCWGTSICYENPWDQENKDFITTA